MRALLLLVILTLTAGVVITLQETDSAQAAHHIAEISEVMSGFDGDPDVQYVEINMRGAGQNVVTNTRLTVFDSNRTFIAVLLLLPSNVSNSGDGVRFLLGTTDFETAAGVQADFEFSAGILPNAGMVCWGAPGLFPPPDPNTWDEEDPNQYVDCVAYGSAMGADPPGNNPTTLTAGDCKHSLTRVVPATFTPPDPPNGTWANTNSATHFLKAVPSPRNNAGANGSLVGVNDADSDNALDCQETAAGSSSADVDSDNDGCADGEELGPNKISGGRRSPTNFWDFFDVPTGMTLVRNQAVAAPDINAVLQRFGANDTGPGTFDRFSDPLSAPNAFVAGMNRENYHPAYDRGPTMGPNNWNLTAANGAVASTDFNAALGQFGDSCVAPP